MSNTILSNKENKISLSNFNYSHNYIYNKTKNFSNKDLVTFRKSPDKKLYQEKRMKYSSTSRYFDNYYDPKLHNKPFIGGKSKDKLMYIYSKTNKGNGNKLNNNIISQNNYKKHFPEFDVLNNKEIIVSIEHCSNCEDHLNHTQHVNNIYLKYSKGIKKAIMIRYPFINVIMKPVEKGSITLLGALEIQMYRAEDKSLILLYSKLKDKSFPSIKNILTSISCYLPLFNLSLKLYNEDSNSSNNMNNYNSSNDKSCLSTEENVFKNIEINIYLLSNPNINFIIDSLKEEIDIIYNPKKKIEYNKAINNTNCINTINNINLSNNKSILPKINEYSSSIKDNTNDYDFKNNNQTLRLVSAYPGIKKNYSRPETSLNNKITNQIANRVNSSTYRTLNKWKSSTNSKANNISIVSNNFIQNNVSNSSLNSFAFKNALSNNNNSMSKHDIRFALNNNNVTIKDGEIIEDKDIANLVKGKHLFKIYSSSNGDLNISNIPYDTYLIVIEESKNFKGTSTILKITDYLIDKTICKTSNATSNNIKELIIEGNADEFQSQTKCLPTIRKIISLKNQTSAVLQLFTYTVLSNINLNNDIDNNNSDDIKNNSNAEANKLDYDLEVVSGCKVMLQRKDNLLNKNCYNQLLINNDNEFFNAKENTKVKGKFETIIEPGTYIIKVLHQDYKTHIKSLEVKQGENTINLELVKDTKLNLQFKIIDYKTKNAIENVLMHIYPYVNNLVIDNNKNNDVKSNQSNKDNYISNKDGLIHYYNLKTNEGKIFKFEKKKYLPVNRTFIRNNLYKEYKTIELNIIMISIKSIEKNSFLVVIYNTIMFNNSISCIDNINNNDKTDNNCYKFIVDIHNELANTNYTKNVLKLNDVEIYEIKIKNLNQSLLNNKKTVLSSLNNNSIEYNNSIKNINSLVSTNKEVARLSLKFDNLELFNNSNNINKLEINTSNNEVNIMNNKSYKNNTNINYLHNYNFNINIYNYNKTLDYFLSSPLFTNENNYNCWDIGFIDLSSFNFYQTNLLNINQFPRELYFSEWKFFIEDIVLKMSLYYNLFHKFSFDKSAVNNNNEKIIHEVAFIRRLRQFVNEHYFNDSNLNNNNCQSNYNCNSILSSEFLIFLSDVFKDDSKNINYTILKDKINSNIKNYSAKDYLQ